MAKVKLDDPIWGLAFNRYVHFLFRGNWIILAEIANSRIDLKVPFPKRIWNFVKKFVKKKFQTEFLHNLITWKALHGRYACQVL